MSTMVPVAQCLAESGRSLPFTERGCKLGHLCGMPSPVLRQLKGPGPQVRQAMSSPVKEVCHGWKSNL